VTLRGIGELAALLSANVRTLAALHTLVGHPTARTMLVTEPTLFRTDGTSVSSVAMFGPVEAWKVALGSPAGGFEPMLISGALLQLGDALSAQQYVDHGPDLEFVRHLRNGVAHGNRFTFRHDEPRRPASFRGPGAPTTRYGKVGEASFFEITPDLEGSPVLFDYIGAGDVIDLFDFIAWRLVNLADGTPSEPLFPQ
jgi:hypothetical protein